ncbi:hypothetical protein V8G54_014549 [Vigna mungo]|uniref:Uncharacterized protein n=1 Tax=Vigna mungo TaxID=3915 RepID=A0AAQ3NGV9_VIGMU
MKPVLILSSGTQRFAPAASSSAVSCEIFKVATSPSSAFSLLKKITETVSQRGNQSAYEVAWGPHEKNEEPHHLPLPSETLYLSILVVVFVIKGQSQMTKKDRNVCLNYLRSLVSFAIASPNDSPAISSFCFGLKQHNIHSV